MMPLGSKAEKKEYKKRFGAEQVKIHFLHRTLKIRRICLDAVLAFSDCTCNTAFP